MTNRLDLTRRSMLGGMAAIATPSIAIASPCSENPVDRVERLSWELADALNAYQGGNFHAVVFPAQATEFAVTFVTNSPRIPSPEARLASAVKEVKSAAMAAMPNISSWTVEIDPTMRCSLVIAGFVSKNSNDRAQVHIDDGSPLLAEDAGGWAGSYSSRGMRS